MDAGSDVRCGDELHLPHGMVLVQPVVSHRCRCRCFVSVVENAAANHAMQFPLSTVNISVLLVIWVSIQRPRLVLSGGEDYLRSDCSSGLLLPSLAPLR